MSRPLMTAAALAALLIAGSTFLATPPAFAAGGTPAWNPSVSENLVRLPNDSLKKALERDFQRSELSGAIADIGAELEARGQSLNDLKAASEQTGGDIGVELRHQLLAEKREYLGLMQRRQLLRMAYLKKRTRVYQRLLEKLRRGAGGVSQEQAQLVEKQMEARQRFQRTVDTVDMELFASTTTPESKYSKEYTKNLSAANALLTAIESHPMNRLADEGADPADKAEYLRKLVADTEAELALVTQEGEIVGYMAKLAALDARKLAEEVEEDQLDLEEREETSPIASAVDLFIN